jgi:ubiquinone biosynthesis protein UbiJ
MGHVKSLASKNPVFVTVAAGLLQAFAWALSRYIAWDPEALKRLAGLAGKVVALHIQLTAADDSHITVYLSPSSTGIAIRPTCAEKVDAQIQGAIFDFARLQYADPKTATLLAKQLKITGDIHLAQTVSQILQQLDIDWVEPISKITGDIVAHRIGAGVRRFQSWRQQRRENLGLNIREYLQEESDHLPTRGEVDSFLAQVVELQHGVARLEATLKRHAAK